MKYKRIKIGDCLYQILDFSLDELVTALEETKPRVNRRIQYPGLYVPEQEKIWYNPDLLISKEDLHLTLLHECTHYLDQLDLLADTKDLPMNEAEMSAEHAYSKDPIKRLLEFRYDKIARKYGLK